MRVQGEGARSRCVSEGEFRLCRRWDRGAGRGLLGRAGKKWWEALVPELKGKQEDPGARLPGLESWLPHLLAVWLQVGYLTSQNLSFSFCKAGITALTPHEAAE